MWLSDCWLEYRNKDTLHCWGKCCHWFVIMGLNVVVVYQRVITTQLKKRFLWFELCSWLFGGTSNAASPLESQCNERWLLSQFCSHYVKWNNQRSSKGDGNTPAEGILAWHQSSWWYLCSNSKPVLQSVVLHSGHFNHKNTIVLSLSLTKVQVRNKDFISVKCYDV